MMWENRRRIFEKSSVATSATNRWDWLALLLILGSLVALAWVLNRMTAPYHLGQPIFISLSVKCLPAYALRTITRMLLALFFSLIFTFVVGAAAAKNKYAEQVLIPAIDILQSVPVLGFLSITITGFIALFPNSILGPECASIFAIFVSQAWNMTLGFYQALRTVPADLQEAGTMLHLSCWQRFWRIEVPFAMPGLLWNSMISMSAGWFFVVVSESITVANHSIMLPGIGSYLALAISEMNTRAVIYAIITMLIVILAYDQLFFRPLVAWSDHFQIAEDEDEGTNDTPWLITLLQHAKLARLLSAVLDLLQDYFINNHFCRRRTQTMHISISPRFRMTVIIFWYVIIALILGLCLRAISQFIYQHLDMNEIRHVFLLGCYTALRVFVLIILCSIIWVPAGVWIGRNPRAARIAQPIAQFLAAFPANLLFPAVVMLIVRYSLNVEIWTTPLMILGTQWYILFNVIAGTKAIPKELYYAAKNFNVQGLLWWRKLVFPGIFPYYVTGAISAAGGAWNASIVAEVVSWGHTTLRAEGLGAYIAQYTALGDYPRIALGIGVMCVFVTATNRLVWRPLYHLSEQYAV